MVLKQNKPRFSRGLRKLLLCSCYLFMGYKKDIFTALAYDIKLSRKNDASTCVDMMHCALRNMAAIYDTVCFLK